MRVGVEVGGTFTDLVAIDGDGVRVAKVPSVPASPDAGALAVLERAGVSLDAVEDLVHGSTTSLNAVLERKGAPIAFLVSSGFRDLLYLQRHDRRRIYDLFYAKPEPVVARRDTFEIDERMGPDGAAVRGLDVAGLGAVLDAPLGSGRYRAVAICLLNGYANPTHEHAVAAWVRANHPGLGVVCSSDVTREFREYERASTVTVAAYIQPVADAYVARLASSLAGRGFAGRFSIMQSNGGRLPASGAAGEAISSLFSGPAAGVTGAVHQAGLAGFGNLITLDMGGTSTDVCVVTGGRAHLSAETEVDGLPIRTPALDIVTVGSGGGSIVWVDDGGMLRVGPRSAGADPGPACYGRGGDEPTVTDAHMIRGSIRAEAFLGGAMRVDVAASRRIFEPLAAAFDMSLEAISDSAICLTDANIVRAIQRVSTERGRDPREYVLVAFGGAGPLHAARVAAELDIGTIVVPPNAGVLSAYGLLAADYARFDTLTRKLAVDDETPAVVRRVFADMEAAARAQAADFGLDGELTFTHGLEMRYVGQAFEVPVGLDAEARAGLDAADLARRLAAAHIQAFGFGGPEYGQAEIVSFRLGLLSPSGAVPALREDETASPQGETRLYDGGAWRHCMVAGRAHIRAAGGVAGPALIEDATSTAYLPEGWRAAVDTCDNLVIEEEQS